MNHRLIKELKEEGFTHNYNQDDNPSLEELIEACGDRFFSLVKKDDRWSCFSIEMEICGEKFVDIANADTPEDAVANLWLNLNKC